MKNMERLITLFVITFAKKTPNSIVGQSNLADKIYRFTKSLPVRLWKFEEAARNVSFDFEEAYFNWEMEESEDYDYLDEEINEGCCILYTAPLDKIEEEETLEEKRARKLREYDVLYGEDLSEYSFEGPVLNKEGVARLAEKFENTHRGSDYEDNYARGLAYKLLSFLEWTPREEFPYGEVMARLEY